VTKDGATDFYFKLHGHKHSFQAASSAERDSWVTRIEAAAAEAKILAPTVTESAKYKEQREHLGMSRPFYMLRMPLAILIVGCRKACGWDGRACSVVLQGRVDTEEEP
jgi:hypothetical protein